LRKSLVNICIYIHLFFSNLKKTKFHRKRIRAEEEEEIDYISEENRKFNLRLEQAFGKYTSEIKENFERGTAL
jgi:pre-mRNA-splicing factor SYF2